MARCAVCSASCRGKCGRCGASLCATHRPTSARAKCADLASGCGAGGANDRSLSGGCEIRAFGAGGLSAITGDAAPGLTRAGREIDLDR